MENLEAEYARIMALITVNSKEYEEDEDFGYEYIEISTFSEIVKFRLLEGVPFPEEDCAILLDIDTYNEGLDPVDEKSCMDGMIPLTIFLEEIKNQAYKTLELNRYFEHKFYNQDY